MNGVVKAVIRKREGQNGGYFFIRGEDGVERFAHASNLIGVDFNDLREGRKVEFEPFEIEGKGSRADAVKPL